MNKDAITIVEADGLFLELLPIRPDGLYGPEQAALSTSFISYARKQGIDGESLSSVRAADKSKYPTKTERAGIVPQALNILLKQTGMGSWTRGLLRRRRQHWKRREGNVRGETEFFLQIDRGGSIP